MFGRRIPHRHVLVRPYIPEGFRTVPGCEDRAFEQRTIFIPGRNPKHPRIWGWILAIRAEDLQREPNLEPGVMIIFDRFGDVRLAYDKPKEPLYPGQRLDISLLHIDAIACTFSPPLVRPPSYV